MQHAGLLHLAGQMTHITQMERTSPPPQAFPDEFVQTHDLLGCATYKLFVYLLIDFYLCIIIYFFVYIFMGVYICVFTYIFLFFLIIIHFYYVLCLDVGLVGGWVCV